MFNYDWFHSGGLDRLVHDARLRCSLKKFPGEAENEEPSEEFRAFYDTLDTRTILYMKDGLTYEMREMADIGMSSALAFECVPLDENYRVGAIVIVAPFEDIARVEVFAVHPEDKPEDNIKIPGFRAAASDPARETR